MKKKLLLIFDFDQTISSVDSFCTIAKIILSKEEAELINNNVAKGVNWVDNQNLMYELAYKHGNDIKKVENALNSIPLNKGIIELFSFLRKNKIIFEIIILSSASFYTLNYLLNYYKINDVIDEIICIKSDIDEKGLMHVFSSHPHNCKYCNACQCKKLEINEFFKSNLREKYNNVIWICDGKNDICLCEELKENDYVFPRKDFALYKKLYDENYKNQIKCKIFPWNDGFDIINKLKEFL